MTTATKACPATRRSRRKSASGRIARFSMALIGATSFVSIALSCSANAQSAKPNILFIVSDDTGYGDLGPYGGGEGRGMPTPNIDKLAADGMTFFSFYAQPSCTPGRAAMQTGRIPNRSGMTTVAFQGQGGGLPAAEWTLASVLKQGGYHTYFTGKWHLGEADYCAAQRAGLRRDEELPGSITSTPIPMPIRPGSRTCRTTCARCSRRSPRARCPARPARRPTRTSRSTASMSTRR